MGKTKKYIHENCLRSFISYKSLINIQKNPNVKDKIKTDVHFDNTFKVNEQKR